MQRPDPALFARLSYYLGIASSAILLIGLIGGYLRSAVGSIVWLALITSGGGAFMAWAARKDFQAQPGEPEVVRMANIGWRVNRLALILLLALLALAIVVRLVIGMGPRISG